MLKPRTKAHCHGFTRCCCCSHCADFAATSPATVSITAQRRTDENAVIVSVLIYTHGGNLIYLAASLAADKQLSEAMRQDDVVARVLCSRRSRSDCDFIAAEMFLAGTHVFCLLAAVATWLRWRFFSFHLLWRI